jgi:hypothetical protein
LVIQFCMVTYNIYRGCLRHALNEDRFVHLVLCLNQSERFAAKSDSHYRFH